VAFAGSTTGAVTVDVTDWLNAAITNGLSYLCVRLDVDYLFVEPILSTLPAGIKISWLDAAESGYGTTLTFVPETKPVQLAEERRMQEFHLGVWYCRDLAENIENEFETIKSLNLNDVVMVQGNSSWNPIETAGESNELRVILGDASSYISESSWNDHAALHNDVRTFINNYADKKSSILEYYYLWDEPDLDKAAKLGKLQQTFFEEDPMHPGIACLMLQDRISACYSAMRPDVLMIDVYAASLERPEGNFHDVFETGQEMCDYIDQARGNIHALDDTSLWTVLQTFGGSGFRKPTVNEIRAMSWLSVAHGAKGLDWFIWHTSPNPGSWGYGLEDKPQERAEVQSLCSDFTSMGKELTNLKWINNIATISGGGSEPLPPVIQDAGFKLYSPASIISDSAASDGSTAKSPNVVGWNVQWHWGKLGFIPSQTYGLYARVKVDKTAFALPLETAFGAGVYDDSSQQYIVTKSVKVSDVNSSYQDILIGTFTPNPNHEQYAYISGSNYAEVPNIYVDKFWMPQNVQAYTAGDVQTFIADSPFRRDDNGGTAQDSSFSLWGDATRINDSTASDGSTARMSNGVDWNIQWFCGTTGYTPGMEYDLWARVAVDHVVGTPTGTAFRLGVWDQAENIYVADVMVPASSTQHRIYQDIKIGTLVPNSNRLIFAAGTNNAANISNIYVDKFWFVGRHTVQDPCFTLSNDAVRVNDLDASDGSAARMSNNGVGWNIHWGWGSSIHFEPGLPYDLYAVVKVVHNINGFTLPTGNAFRFGVWDYGSETWAVPDTVVPVSLSKDMVYRTYKIGTFIPQNDQYVYFAAANNSTNVPEIYVDKIFFVPKGDHYFIAVNHNVVDSETVTVSFPKSVVDKYGLGNVSARDVLTGNSIALSGSSTLSFSRFLPPGGGAVVKVISNQPLLIDAAMSCIPGDANEDGMVDVGDLGILAANYGGSNKSWTQGDFNDDHLVDVGDLGILAAHYGEGSTQASNFSEDYAKAFGTTVADDMTDDADIISSSVCSAIGLPLIAGLALMSLMLLKLKE
jgi:hypothetical protein